MAICHHLVDYSEAFYLWWYKHAETLDVSYDTYWDDVLLNDIELITKEAQFLETSLFCTIMFDNFDCCFQSPWNRYFQDNELRVTIKQDVIRTWVHYAVSWVHYDRYTFKNFFE